MTTDGWEQRLDDLGQARELREEIASWLADNTSNPDGDQWPGYDVDTAADALLSGPLAPLLAAVAAVLAKCDQMEREAPKPQVGGFMAEEFRRTVTAALDGTP